MGLHGVFMKWHEGPSLYTMSRPNQVALDAWPAKLQFGYPLATSEHCLPARIGPICGLKRLNAKLVREVHEQGSMKVQSVTILSCSALISISYSFLYRSFIWAVQTFSPWFWTG